MDKEQKQTHPEVGEDATQYGEFISTYFAWIPLPDQKENAERMANITKKEYLSQNASKKEPSQNSKEEK